jgi:glutathione synthase
MIAAFQIDPLDSLKFTSDTSILLGLELQSRGFKIYAYQPDQLNLIQGKPVATGQFVKLYSDPDRFYEIIADEPLALEDAKLIMIRQDPPFNMEYITTTYLLDLIKDKVLVLNDPQAIRDNAEKLIVYNLPQHLPPSLLSNNLNLMREFWQEHKDVIIKPIYGHGGHFITHVGAHDDFDSIAGAALLEHRQIIVQKFLPEITHGDTRVMMLNGEVLGVMRRVPAEGDILSNLVAGASAISHELTPKEQIICRDVGQLLKEKNIFFAGVDLINEKLIEINLTSPTGIKMLNKLYNANYERAIVDSILKILA